MVDDNVKQLRAFKGQGILFTAPRNVNETGFVRVNNWLEARTWFMAELQKDQHRSGEPERGVEKCMRGRN
jgi:5'(3')-deoxyribonucleotidase